MSRWTGLTAAALLAACHSGPAANAVAVLVTPANAVIPVGDSLQFSATLADADGGAVGGGEFTWLSSDPAIVKVSASGLATGVARGAAVISAATSTRSGNAQVTAVQLTVEATASIGPAGGTVAVTDPASALYGVTLTVPAGALSSAQSITISSPDPEPPLPAGMVVRGRTAIMRPEGLTFAQPAQLTMPMPAPLDEGGSMLLYTSTPDGQLEPEHVTESAEGADQQVTATTITGFATHFTSKAVLEAREVAAAVRDGSSGCGKLRYIDGRCRSCKTQPRAQVDQIIVHSTNSDDSTTFANEVHYAMTNRKAFAHYYIGPGGEIVQVVPDGDYAPHVASGTADLVNLHAIGIELFQPHSKNHYADYSDAQKAALVRLASLLMAKYGITPDNVTRHKEHTASADHQDPYGWDDAAWNAFKPGFVAAPASDPGFAGCDLPNGHGPGDGGTPPGDGGSTGGSAIWTVTVSITGTGSGTVASDPPGPTYLDGTVVTLNAIPDSRSTFTGWSGACAGTLPCQFRVSDNVAVTAHFSLPVADAGTPDAGTPDGGGACGVAQVAGGDTPDTREIEMHAVSGTFSFSYDTASIPDRIVVSYQGLPLFDTGCVGASGGKTLFYGPGSSTSLTVAVSPNCSGGTSGTYWAYTIGCPQ